MFISSAFRVLHLSPHELQVVAPPHYLLVIIFALPALVGLWVLWRALATKSLLFLALGLVWCGGWGLGSWGFSRSGWVRLDTANNTATFDMPRVLFGREHFIVPLDQARNAQITTSHASERIVLVLKDGRYLGFTGYSDQAGQEETVHAINEFLGVRSVSLQGEHREFGIARIKSSKSQDL